MPVLEGAQSPSLPLFILSGPRSGSTLLRYILDTHSEIACPGEIGLGALCNQLEWVIRGTQSKTAGGGHREASIAQTRAIIDGIMGSYLAAQGKRLWCEKTVRNLQDLDILLAVFPDARFLCLHRDILDVVHSCLECSRLGFMPELSEHAARQPQNLVAAMATAWVENTARMLDFERQNPERCFRVRYEDLVTAPEDCLRPLLRFVGVDWEEGLLASVFDVDHADGGDIKILFSDRIDPSRMGGGQRLHLAAIPEEIRQAADWLCQQLSYPPLTPGRRLPWASAEPGMIDDVALDASHRSIEAYLTRRLNERARLAARIQGTCRLVLQGLGGGTWTLRFANGSPSIGPAEDDADCSLIADVPDFIDVIAGRVNPMVAIWDSKVVIEGDVELGRQVGRVIFR